MSNSAKSAAVRLLGIQQLGTSPMNAACKILWDMYAVWNNACIKSAYTSKRAIILKTKALIAMDK